jgi:biotin transport system ATP-binding protein
MPTVSEDIAFGLRSLRRSREQSAAAVAAILDAFGVAHLENRPVAELSGGEKRLITLLGILVMEPRYLILDEPMSGLDLYQRRRFAEWVEGLAQNVVLITHDFEHLAGFDRVLALHEGRVAFDGTPRFVTTRWMDRYA